MAIELPAAQKVYTTKYDNFRGVDFTDDPSNVWSHRSPNAVNMMPDLAGRPWKRTGWEIVEDTQNFIDCYNTATGESYSGELIPQKVYYFQLGGEDFLAICNNLGLFFYSRFLGASSDETPYLLFVDGYYAEGGNVKTSIKIEPNANRGFFFEGNGTAGFYIFCTTTSSATPPVIETSLFRFDGNVLRKVEPYVPTIMIAKQAGDTAGEIYENPNILTLKRICQFIGDGSSKNFILPERADLGKTFTVELLISGVWTTQTVTTHYSATDYNYDGGQVTKVSFVTAPASGGGADNVRVTYSVYGSNVSQASKALSANNIIKSDVITQKRTQTYVNGKLTNTSAWANLSTSYGKPKAVIWKIPNLALNSNKPDVTVYARTNATTWSSTAISASNLDTSYKAYTSELQVNIKSLTGIYNTKTTTYGSVTSTSSTKKSSGKTIKTVTQTRKITNTYRYPIKATANVNVYSSSPTLTAFTDCSRVMVYGDGLINSVFTAGSSVDDYKSRVWWSATLNPSYFPDINYIEAGSNDTQIAGLMKVGEYLGIIKQGQSFDSTIYLAYPTKVASGEITDGSTTTTTYTNTFAIKSSIGGIGAVSNGAFNILNDEPLFLSIHGVMGINPTNENEKQIRNRSYFVNKRLTQEPNLETAFSFVWRNMYILSVNNHCYVLDGSQKTSWANEKTNLQYEAYYWENVPAQCFARYDEELWFTDYRGRLCRFKPDMVTTSYHDDYDINDPTTIPYYITTDNESIEASVDVATFLSQVSNTGQYTFTYTSAGYLHRTLLGQHFGNAGVTDVNSSPRTGDEITDYLHAQDGWKFNGEYVDLATYGITLSGAPIQNDTITVSIGKAIMARWSTVLDDDGAAHYFKTLQKKGTMAVLYPQSSTGVNIYIKKDDEPQLLIGTATVRTVENEIVAPSDFYLKKKSKKYKRLQIIAENDGFDETFGIDEIIKCYTVGNYSRNRSK